MTKTQRRIIIKLLRAEMSVMDGWRGDTWDRRSRLFRRARRVCGKSAAIRAQFVKSGMPVDLDAWESARRLAGLP